MRRWGWGRRVDVPDDVRAAAMLAPAEQLLAAARLADDAWALGTDRRLAVVERAAVLDDGSDVLRLDRCWHQVDIGLWDGEDGVLELTWVGGGRTRLTVADRRDVRLATVLRERVQSSVLLTRELDSGVRLVARRVQGAGPDEPGLLVQVIAARGVDVSGELAAEVQAEVRALEVAIGVEQR